MLVDLQDGELVHGENFSLFAAMSALEVRTSLSPLLFCCVSTLIFSVAYFRVSNDVFVFTKLFYATSGY